MGKTLIIAEKPKVANEILKSSRFRNSTKHPGSAPYFGYFENNEYIVSWCMGHLLEVMNPEDHDPALKAFKFDNLPIILDTKYKPKKELTEQLNILDQLLKRNDVDHVINAADKDREGELLFREVYEYSGVDKKLSRLWLSSYEPAELEAGLNRLLPGSDLDSFADSARARQYLDHLLGINITRGCTSKLAKNTFLLASGRIQMCLLHEIRKRELEIQNFQEKTFYNLVITTDNGITAQLKTDIQYLNPGPLNDIANKIINKPLKVQKYDDKDKKKHPKQLYNLTDIYKEAHAKFKTNAEVTKKHIQNLYENGYITYPRTDSRNLPVEMVEKVQNTFDMLQTSNDYSKMAAMVDNSVISEKHNTFNDELVSSHFAIIPTLKEYNTEGRPQLEKDLYDLIVKRFIGRFMSSAVYKSREILLIDEENNEYFASEKILIEPGFLAVFKDETEEDVTSTFTIPEVKLEDSLIVTNTNLTEGKTRRPALHTESSILTFMETAGRTLENEDLRILMKGKRIGTVATEETFIPKLLQRKYIETDKSGKLTTTEIGAKFVDSFPVEELKNPEYTAELEGEITSIANHEISLDAFKQKANDFAQLVIDKLAALNENITETFIQSWNHQVEICDCPCGNKNAKIIDKGEFYGCSHYPECKISLKKKLKGKTIPPGQIKKLFVDKKTDIIKGFKTEEDKEFSAYLVLEEGKLKFKFPSAEELSLGPCPKCKTGFMLQAKTKEDQPFYSCSAWKEGCKFTLPGTLLKKELPISEIKKLLKNGHTDFINGFISKDKGNEFTAAIVLKEDLSIAFQMPTKEDRSIGKCPLCKGSVLVGKSYYLCENYKETCDFIINPVILGKQITPNQVAKLLDKNITDLIKGFKNKDKTFDAKLSYDSTEKRIKFVFEQKKKKSNTNTFHK